MAAIAQPIPILVNTQVHIHGPDADLRYMGSIAVNIPRHCMMELCTKSQKSTSVTEPELFVALLHAKNNGIRQIDTARQTDPIRAELR
jgi:hypothetical protein